MIISVGYRVNSKRGVKFRQWANNVLKEFLLRGYAINQRFERLERTVAEQGKRISEIHGKIDFYVQTSLPPQQGIFYDGQIKRHNEQYLAIAVEQFNKSHDRFLMIDEDVYHIGASIKDLGKKWFAFTLMQDIKTSELIKMMIAYGS